jgi:hypothetical protein
MDPESGHSCERMIFAVFVVFLLRCPQRRKAKKTQQD